MLLSRELERLIKDCEALDLHPTANHLLRLAVWQEAQQDLAVRTRLEDAICENKLVVDAHWRGQRYQVKKLRDFKAAKNREACAAKRREEERTVIAQDLLRQFANFQAQQQKQEE